MFVKLLKDGWTGFVIVRIIGELLAQVGIQDSESESFNSIQFYLSLCVSPRVLAWNSEVPKGFKRKCHLSGFFFQAQITSQVALWFPASKSVNSAQQSHPEAVSSFMQFPHLLPGDSQVGAARWVLLIVVLLCLDMFQWALSQVVELRTNSNDC